MSTETKTEQALTPSWKKPEFWVTMLTNVTGILMAVGALTADQASTLNSSITTIIGSVMAILSSFKFVNIQHAAKVEVFRAMCAMQLEPVKKTKTKDGVTVQSASVPVETVARIAKVAGL